MTREEIERHHWWFVGRRVIVEVLAAELPDGPLLDVGCGYRGAFTVTTDSTLKVGLDIEATPLKTLRENYAAPGIQAFAENLPFADGSFSRVLLLDVLEHVRDDYLALAEALRVLRPGGRALITVPAFPSLWSSHDQAEMHLRRYRRHQLVRLCKGAGFRITKCGYFNTLLFPVALIWRIISRKIFSSRRPRDDFYMLPYPINAFLGAIFSAERFVLPYVGAPFGLSLFALAEKTSAAACGS